MLSYEGWNEGEDCIEGILRFVFVVLRMLVKSWFKW